MRIAVLGAGGMLGHQVYSVLRHAWPDTHALFHKPAELYRPFGLFDQQRSVGGVDVRDGQALDTLLDRLAPDAVVNCVGLTTRKLGGHRDSEIVLVNAVVPHRLKEWAIARRARLVHFSTDCVFSGDNGPYRPDSLKDAQDLYGLSKSLGEVEGPGVLTIRSSIVGLELEGKTELIEWFLSQRGKSVRGFSNVIYSGVTTRTMAEVVRTLLADGGELSGIHQLASEPISKLDLLREAAAAFDIDVAIEPVAEPVSNKALVQSDFFNSRGIVPPSWRYQLLAIARDRAPQGASALASGE